LKTLRKGSEKRREILGVQLRNMHVIEGKKKEREDKTILWGPTQREGGSVRFEEERTEKGLGDAS